MTNTNTTGGIGSYPIGGVSIGGGRGALGTSPGPGPGPGPSPLPPDYTGPQVCGRCLQPGCCCERWVDPFPLEDAGTPAPPWSIVSGDWSIADNYLHVTTPNSMIAVEPFGPNANCAQWSVFATVRGGVGLPGFTAGDVLRLWVGEVGQRAVLQLAFSGPWKGSASLGYEVSAGGTLTVLRAFSFDFSLGATVQIVFGMSYVDGIFSGYATNSGGIGEGPNTIHRNMPRIPLGPAGLETRSLLSTGVRFDDFGASIRANKKYLDTAGTVAGGSPCGTDHCHGCEYGTASNRYQLDITGIEPYGGHAGEEPCPVYDEDGVTVIGGAAPECPESVSVILEGVRASLVGPGNDCFWAGSFTVPPTACETVLSPLTVEMWISQTKLEIAISGPGGQLAIRSITRAPGDCWFDGLTIEGMGVVSPLLCGFASVTLTITALADDDG